MPKGIFDPQANPLGWFDEEEKPVGWFSREFLDDGSAPTGGAAPDVPRGRAALVVGAIIVAAWAGPQLSALKLSAATETGPTVAQVQPPHLEDQQVARNAAWRVTWDTQRRPRAIVSVDAPPPREQTPSVEAWRTTWPAQRATQGLPWLYVAAPAADNPPPRVASLPPGFAQWQPAALTTLKVSTATEGGDWVLPPETADTPPPAGKAWLWSVLAKHQPAKFGSYSSSVYTEPVSDPPRLRRQDLTGMWPRGWGLPQTLPRFPITPPPAVVNDPPPRVVQPTTIREQWQARATWQVPQRLPTVTESGAVAPVADVLLLRWLRVRRGRGE